MVQCTDRGGVVLVATSVLLIRGVYLPIIPYHTSGVVDSTGGVYIPYILGYTLVPVVYTY